MERRQNMKCLDTERQYLAVIDLLKTLSQAGMFIRKEFLLTEGSYHPLVLQSQLQKPAFPEAAMLSYRLSSHHLECLRLASDLCCRSELFKTESSKLSDFLLNIHQEISFLLQRNSAEEFLPLQRGLYKGLYANQGLGDKFNSCKVLGTRTLHGAEFHLHTVLINCYFLNLL